MAQLVINFIGNFTTPNMVGEVSDETHLARELERLGHTVRKIDRAEWREYVIEGFPKGKYKVPEDLKADINIVAKWHHFYDGSFITALRDQSRAGTGSAKHEGAVIYWVWDFMGPDFPDWHIKMAQAADLYLSGEGGLAGAYQQLGVNFQYFQMDACDGDLPIFEEEKKINVLFTGTCYRQGHRVEWLKKINEQVHVVVYGPNHEDWLKEGFEAYPPVYGSDYNKLIAQAKIVLGFNYTIPCWGYWSNRIGKVLRAGGFLLHEYVPGMEQFLPEGAVKYFSSPEEAIEMIYYYLSSKEHTDRKAEIARKLGYQFTSAYKVRRLTTILERLVKQ